MKNIAARSLWEPFSTQQDAVPAVQNHGITSAPSLSLETWATFCAWLTENLRGMETTIERGRGGAVKAFECHSKPLESISLRTTKNGVSAITITVRMNGGLRKWDLFGPESIQIERNAAGWPTKIEIGSEEGGVVLQFTGSAVLSEKFSGNSWGE